MNVTLYRDATLIDLLDVCHRLAEDEREQVEALGGSPFNAETLAAEFHLRAGPKWVFCSPSRTLAVAGFDLVRHGVWQTWMLSTPETWIPENWRGVTRHARNLVAAMLRADAHRLQCLCMASRIRVHRWYKSIDLEYEACFKGYGVKGQDAFMFSSLKVK